MKINPKFKKLNKPIAREVLAHEEATLEEIAIAVEMKPLELLSQVRVALGQDSVKVVYADIAQINDWKNNKYKREI